MERTLKKVNNLGFILLSIMFIWISLFAPLFFESIMLYFLVIIATVLFILMYIKNNLKIIFSFEDLFFLLFFVFLSMGIATAIDKTIALRYFMLFALPVPFIYLFAKISFDKSYGIFLFRIISCLGFLVVVYGLIEFFFKVNPVFELNDSLYSFYYGIFSGKRMLSLHMHPTPLATYLVAILPVSFGLLIKESKRIYKVLAGINCLFILCAIVLTFSRGGLLGCLVSLVLVIVALRKSINKKFLSILIICIVMIIVTVLVMDSLNLSTINRFSVESLIHPHSYMAKINRTIKGFNMFKAHPFLGIGLGQYRVLFDKFCPFISTNYDGKVADLMFVTILTELGIFGFLSFIAFLIIIYNKSIKSLKGKMSANQKFMIAVLLAGLSGIIVTFLTYDVLYWFTPAALFWIYCAFLSVLSKRSK
ncbi:MAG: O-antigen ligase family protein [Candidatus Gygaella obscura]|nr:O-antigen ligase family protein [Candidatus Gygaella obscura]